ncbi:MAG TPA: signal peptidase I [Methanosarcinaceae archaeon]|nr:signal peptidase I [Methanosarcinaceae archaeon]
MQNTIIYTAGLTFLVLLIVYLQTTGKIAIQNTKLIYPIKRILTRNNSVDSYLKNRAIAFKTKAATKNLFFILLTTLLIGFILYSYVFFTTPVSNSMRPTFEVGDLVLMQKFDTESQKGDIVMFGQAFIGKDQIIIHRVYSVTPEGIKTKGDAGAIDYWITRPEQIYAKAITIGGQPIVIKSVGHYFLDTQISSSFAREFGFMQAIVQGGKKFGLLIFVICIVAYTWLSINDIKKQNKYRRN